MTRGYSFRVPASTANLGAGFDALSLAFEKYLRVSVTVEPSLPVGERGRSIEVRGMDVQSIPATSENLILRVASSVARQRNKELPALRMAIDNEIPLARGLGMTTGAWGHVYAEYRRPPTAA